MPEPRISSRITVTRTLAVVTAIRTSTTAPTHMDTVFKVSSIDGSPWGRAPTALLKTVDHDVNRVHKLIL